MAVVNTSVLFGAVALLIGAFVWVMAKLLKRTRLSGTMDLPSLVVEHLRSGFKVDEDVLRRMRYLARPGRLGGKKINYVRLFDPSLLRDAIQIKWYADIEDDRRALRFDGHIFKDRPQDIHLADQRGY